MNDDRGELDADHAKLVDVVARLEDIPPGDGFAAGPVIYALRPWTPESEALLLAGDEVPDGTRTDSGFDYLLEVDIALEVVEVWSQWRDGATPTAEEATRAVIYYGEHDAYQP